MIGTTTLGEDLLMRNITRYTTLACIWISKLTITPRRQSQYQYQIGGVYRLNLVVNILLVRGDQRNLTTTMMLSQRHLHQRVEEGSAAVSHALR